jgi:hypothetical protein
MWMISIPLRITRAVSRSGNKQGPNPLLDPKMILLNGIDQVDALADPDRLQVTP